jgi:hypothetical protein
MVRRVQIRSTFDPVRPVGLGVRTQFAVTSHPDPKGNQQTDSNAKYRHLSTELSLLNGYGALNTGAPLFEVSRWESGHTRNVHGSHR